MIWSWQHDWQNSPLKSRVPGILFGTLLAITACGLCVSARAAPAYLGVLAVTALILLTLHSFQHRSIIDRSKQAHTHGDIYWPVLLFLMLAAMSAFWAEDGAISLWRSCTAVLALLALLAVKIFILHLDEVNCRHVVEGLWIGVVFGFVYLAIEAWTGQVIFRALINGIGLGPDDLEPKRFYIWQDNRLVATMPDTLSRNFAPTTLILWPTLYLVGASFTSDSQSTVRLSILAVIALAIFASDHESSKLALVVGCAIFSLAWFSVRYARRVLYIGWVVACLFIVPIAHASHSAGLQNANWLQASARERVNIWYQTATVVSEAPWIGHGVRSAYVRSARSAKSEKSKPNSPVSTSSHPHNLYLQVWYELGILGAVLLLWFGIRCLSAVDRLPHRAHRYALAFLSSCAALLATSYGLWQTWLLALLAIAGLLMILLHHAGHLILPSDKPV